MEKSIAFLKSFNINSKLDIYFRNFPVIIVLKFQINFQKYEFSRETKLCQHQHGSSNE